MFDAVKQDFGGCDITHSGWVDCNLFIDAFAQWLMQNDLLIKSKFLYDNLQFNNGLMKYAELEFDNIIF